MKVTKLKQDLRVLGLFKPNSKLSLIRFKYENSIVYVDGTKIGTAYFDGKRYIFNGKNKSNQTDNKGRYLPKTQYNRKCSTNKGKTSKLGLTIGDIIKGL